MFPRSSEHEPLVLWEGQGTKYLGVNNEGNSGYDGLI